MALVTPDQQQPLKLQAQNNRVARDFPYFTVLAHSLAILSTRSIRRHTYNTRPAWPYFPSRKLLTLIPAPTSRR